jgi:hypothetical protein
MSFAGSGAGARGVVAAITASFAARGLAAPITESSGSLTTSSARARLGRRRMKPRSSSAEIRRWTPDLLLRSSASFISSKLGEIPVSSSFCWMKRINSCCLAVSIVANSRIAAHRRVNEYGTIRQPRFVSQAIPPFSSFLVRNMRSLFDPICIVTVQSKRLVAEPWNTWNIVLKQRTRTGLCLVDARV